MDRQCEMQYSKEVRPEALWKQIPVQILVLGTTKAVLLAELLNPSFINQKTSESVMSKRAQWERWQDMEGNTCTPRTRAWDRLLMGLIGVPQTQTCHPPTRLTYGIMRQNSISISSLGHLYPFDRWRKYLRSQTTWYWLYSAISASWWQFIALHRKNMLRRHCLNFIFGKTKLKTGFPV